MWRMDRQNYDSQVHTTIAALDDKSCTDDETLWLWFSVAALDDSDAHYLCMFVCCQSRGERRPQDVADADYRPLPQSAGNHTSSKGP